METGGSGGRRRPEEISADIVRAAFRDTSKTRIMYSARLNYKQLKRYLQYLTVSGLLHSDGRGNIYTPTDKGKSYLACYDETERLKTELRDKEREIHRILPLLGELIGPAENASGYSD